MSGGYFFNGKEYITPTVVSAVNNSAMADQNGNLGNKLVLVGQSADGAPNTELQFSDFPSALAALGSGDLVDACRAAFSPSDDPDVGAPATISCIRVNPATQSTISLLDGSAAAVIDVTSNSWGVQANQVKVTIAAGTVQGIKASVASGLSFFSQDNIYNAAFSVLYSGGQASAKMSVADTTVTLEAPTGTTVATIDLTAFTTVQSLTDRINAVAGFSATVLNGNGNAPTAHGLDFVSEQDVKTALYTATATLQAVVNWLNSSASGLVTAIRHTGAGTLPANISNAYLTGGGNGSLTNTNWSNAFTLMQGIDCQWMCALSSASAIQDMADAHAVYMSTIAMQERRNFVGTATGTTDAQAIAAAALFNSTRTALLHLGYYDYDVITGVYKLYQPYILAALIAGAFAGTAPGTPMTNKSIKVQGMERALLKPSNTDALILGGVLCVAPDTVGFTCVKSITTWLTDNNYTNVEISTGAALDFTMRTWRAALSVLKGQPGSPTTLGLAISISESTLADLAVAAPNGPGVLVGDDTSPAYKNLTAGLVGDVIAVTGQVSPGVPTNFVGVTAYAVPYSGTASATSTASA